MKRINKKSAFLIWSILWVPISFLFPIHSHFPISGVFAPISAFLLPFTGNATHSSFPFDWQYVYLPALFFWTGGIIFVIAITKITKRLWSKT